MGILTNIKVLTDEGKLKDSAKANFINEVIEKAKKRKPKNISKKNVSKLIFNLQKEHLPFRKIKL